MTTELPDDECECEEPTFGTLDAGGLRQLAAYLDVLENQRAECDGIQPTEGQLLIPTDADSDGRALVAFRWGDDATERPRVCLFGSNDGSPDF